MDLSNRTDLPAAFDERAIVTQFLKYVRLTVHAKSVGLSPSDAAATPLPGSPAIIFLGQQYQWPGTDDDSALQMRAGLERPLADLLEEYEVQAAHTDEVVASHDWDAESALSDNENGQPVTLRYIAMHLIEETARHNGHLDILRELADGVTGV